MPRVAIVTTAVISAAVISAAVISAAVISAAVISTPIVTTAIVTTADQVAIATVTVPIDRQTIAIGTATNVLNTNDRLISIARTWLFNYANVSASFFDVDAQFAKGTRQPIRHAHAAGEIGIASLSVDIPTAHHDEHLAIDGATPDEQRLIGCGKRRVGDGDE